MWFLCRQYGAEQALDWGLVNAVVPLDDLERETVAWCRQMLTLSPIALRMIKAGMNAADDGLAGEEGTGTERLNLLPAEARLHAGLTRALRRGQAEATVRRDIDPETFAVGVEAIVIALIIAILQTGGEADPRSSAGVLAVLEASIRPAPLDR